MNLLIVDDDAVEVQIICGIVKKEQLGIDNIFYAYRTAQAKKIVEENPVEIIVSRWREETDWNFWTGFRRENIQRAKLF